MGKSRKFLMFWLTVCLSLMFAMTAMADESEIINEARNGVLQVNLVYVDKNGNTFPIQGGSGFLINDQTLLTNQHVVQMSDKTEKAASEAYGVDFVNDSSLDVRVQVVVQRDVVIDATVKKSSAEMDVAIVELSEPIYDRKPLALGDSSLATEAQTIYALGFPQAAELAQDINYYTNKDVTVINGIIGKKVEVNGTPFLQHSAKLSGGNSGGPLLNPEGSVIGINQFRTNKDEYYYAMEINDIKTLLDAIGISYIMPDSQSSPQPDSETGMTEQSTEMSETGGAETDGEEEADKTALLEKIQEAEKVDAALYSEESMEILEEKLENAKVVASDTGASQSVVEQKTQELDDALKQLEEQGGLGIWLWVIVAGAVIAVVVIIIIIVLVTGGSKKQQGPRGNMRPDVEIPPVPSPSPVEDSGNGETSVLSEGAGETTVLGAGGQAGGAYLIRCKNKEKISVTGPVFTMGKERRRVNYCVSDNSSISRSHARISRKGGKYFISDMNSTNFTFVNGVKVSPGEETALSDGDAIRLSDEEFEFHLR